MLFQSGQLFFCILLFITVFVVCKWVFRKGWLNNVVLLLGNALVLTNIVRPQSVLILLIVAVVCYGAGVLLQRKKWRWLLALTLVLLVALFAIRSYPLVWKWFGEFWTTSMKKPFFSVEKLGLSYILFRLIHWLVECRRGTLRTRNFLSYINYLFFFPTFMAGPIDTLNNFHYWINTTRVRFNARMLLAGVGRIFLGAVKALLVVPLLDEVCHHIMDLCRQENVPYIDATDMSDMPGVFKDIQHHNSYGAYFIYLKIKDYVLEKENR